MNRLLGLCLLILQVHSQLHHHHHHHIDPIDPTPANNTTDASVGRLQKMMSRLAVSDWESCKPRPLARPCQPHSRCIDVSLAWELINYVCVPRVVKKGERCDPGLENVCIEGTFCNWSAWYSLEKTCTSEPPSTIHDLVGKFSFFV